MSSPHSITSDSITSSGVPRRAAVPEAAPATVRALRHERVLGWILWTGLVALILWISR